MAPSRHKHVRAREPRLASLHLKRPSLPAALSGGRVRPTVRVGIAVAATVGVVSSGVAMSQPDKAAVSAISAPAASATESPSASTDPVGVREEPISRAAARVTLKKKPEPAPKATGYLFVTTLLNAWSGPGERFDLLTVLPEGKKVAVSGVVKGPWAEIVVGKQSRWVRAEYLSKTKPEPEPEEAAEAGVVARATGVSSAPCASGSSVESGLTSNAIAVHRAVCAAFPSVTSYGGLRPGDGGEHGSGRALDIMVTGSTGDAIADWVRDHASALGVSEVLWSQKIWTVERAGDGWRYQEDRGSSTANHYDHVHVTVY